MKLKALDQISLSAVQADSLRPGQEFFVNKTTGEDLLKAHPSKFEKISDDDAPADSKPAPEPISATKAEDPPKNKAKPAPANKSTRAKRK